MDKEYVELFCTGCGTALDCHLEKSVRDKIAAEEILCGDCLPFEDDEEVDEEPSNKAHDE